MSRTTMYAFPKSGPCVELAEFPNSWGSAARIWNALSERYLGERVVWMLPNRSEQLWALVDDPQLTQAERDVLESTFDHVLVHRNDFDYLAGVYRAFSLFYPPGKSACHLNAIATVLEQLVDGKMVVSFEVYAVGWRWTSCAENLWQVRDENDDSRPYNLALDSRHRWLFDDTVYGE